MYKCIIFDAYGTLISTGTGSVDAVRKILKGKGINISAEEFYKEWKVLHKGHMSSLPEFLSEKEIFSLDLKMLYERYSINSNYNEDVKYMLASLFDRLLFDDVREALNTVAKDYDIIIGSNTDTAPLIQNLEYNSLVIEKIYTSEILECYKPDNRFYEKILEITGYSPNEALFVGDSLIDDVYGPQQAGINACWINRMGRDNLTDITPNYEVSSLSELQSILSK